MSCIAGVRIYSSCSRAHTRIRPAGREAPRARGYCNVQLFSQYMIGCVCVCARARVRAWILHFTISFYKIYLCVSVRACVRLCGRLTAQPVYF